jgi:hypothetical protein
MPQVGTSSTWKILHTQLRPSLTVVRPTASQRDTFRYQPQQWCIPWQRLEMVLGVSWVVSCLPEPGPEVPLQAYMMRAWATFADDSVNELTEKIAWPTSNFGATTLVRLGFSNSPCADFILPGTYDSPCSSLNPSFYGLRPEANRVGT